MSGSQPITLIRAEIEALHTFMQTQSQVRTYKIQRDTRNILLLVEPSGRVVRLTP